MALLRVAALYERYWPGLPVFLIFTAAVFHAALAVVLVLFPYEQLLTEGTAPVFALFSRYVWAVGFGVATTGIGVVLRWRRPLVHAVVWVGVAFLFGAWFIPLTLAVLDGGGSPVAVVVWLFLYGLFFGGAISNALKQR